MSEFSHHKATEGQAEDTRVSRRMQFLQRPSDQTSTSDFRQQEPGSSPGSGRSPIGSRAGEGSASQWDMTCPACLSHSARQAHNLLQQPRFSSAIIFCSLQHLLDLNSNSKNNFSIVKGDQKKRKKNSGIESAEAAKLSLYYYAHIITMSLEFSKVDSLYSLLKCLLT